MKEDIIPVQTITKVHEIYMVFTLQSKLRLATKFKNVKLLFHVLLNLLANLKSIRQKA